MELISRPILDTIIESTPETHKIILFMKIVCFRSGLIIKNLDFEEFMIITSPRQSGKTSILLLLNQFLESKSNPTFFISLEDPDILSR